MWAGISSRGATSEIASLRQKLESHFEEELLFSKADKYCAILDEALKPFIEKTFPNGNYRFQQDNDPKHTSRLTWQYFIDSQINWWKTPSESPDLNPLKYYLR